MYLRRETPSLDFGGFQVRMGWEEWEGVFCTGNEDTLMERKLIVNQVKPLTHVASGALEAAMQSIYWRLMACLIAP